MYIPNRRTERYLPCRTSRGNKKYVRFDGYSKTFKPVYHKDFSIHPPLEGDETGLNEIQAWIALEKAWVAFRTYKQYDNVLMMEKYANVINIMKEKLGFPRIEFYF